MRAGLPVLALLLVAAAPPPAITLPVDAPILASINGKTVALSLATGGVDRLTLNKDTVAQLGIKPAAPVGRCS
jgi:hypothetical protein